MEEDQQRQVEIAFFSTHPSIASIPETPLRVPVDLKRYGLSEIVNHILATGDNKRPFDFLINGQLLRTSLRVYMDKAGRSLEESVRVEVIESLLPPRQVDSFMHDDWISSVDSFTCANGDALYLTGCYDGKMRLWSGKGDCLAVMDDGVHTSAIKSVSFVRDGGEDVRCVAGSLDGSASSWVVRGLSALDSVKVSCDRVLMGSEGAVEGVIGNSDAVFGASFDNRVLMWSHSGDLTEISTISALNKKRRKVENSRPSQMPDAAFVGHMAPVSAICFDYKSPLATLYSAGMDHSVRIWDIETSTNVHTLNSPHAALSVACSADFIASGHSDRVIRLWDPRSSSTMTASNALVKLNMTGHSSWISGLSWCPDAQHHLVSSSYDGTLKVWDVRSHAAIYTVPAGGADALKLMDVAWGKDTIACGGESKQLHIFSNRSDVVGQ